MQKILIKDYAKQKNISVQSVYAKVKKGSLVSTEIDKKKYIVLCSENTEEKKEDLQPLLEEKNNRIQELENSLNFFENERKRFNPNKAKKEIEELKNDKNFFFKFSIFSSVFIVVLFSLLIYRSWSVLVGAL